MQCIFGNRDRPLGASPLLSSRLSHNISSNNHDEALGDVQVYPDRSTVAFGLGLHGCVFTLRQFANRRNWTVNATNADAKPLEHAFNRFMLDLILKIFDAVMNFKKDVIGPMLEKLEVELSAFLPVGDSLQEMAVINLPSPAIAQIYCVETLYEGPMDDNSATCIRGSDP
ncbi:hypothetical protein FPV67DRAFT_1423941, partial [Lyophyllum atratum]